METYVVVPAWLVLWLFSFIVAQIYFQRKRNPTFRSLLLQLRIWSMALIMLLFFSVTKFEKASLLQTALLTFGPLLSLIPITRFWIKRRELLREN